MMGRSRTISANELPSKASCRSGSNKASAIARRSRSSSVSSFRVCAITRLKDSVLTRHLPGHSGLFDHADEHVFEREARLASRQHANPCSLELRGDSPHGVVDGLYGDHVHAIAEQRHPPALHDGFEPVGCELRRGHLEFDEMARLLTLDAARRSFGNQLTGY